MKSTSKLVEQYHQIDKQQQVEPKQRKFSRRSLKIMILSIGSIAMISLLIQSFRALTPLQQQIEFDTTEHKINQNISVEERWNEEVNEEAKQIFIKLQKHMKKVEAYEKIHIVQKFKQLPFCLLVVDNPSLNETLTSIQKQKYTNYKTIILTPNTSLSSRQKSVFWDEKSNYYQLKKIIEGECHEKDLLFFVKAQLSKDEVLQDLNSLFQIRNLWSIYTQINSLESYQIIVCFAKLFLNLEKNDFKGTNAKFLAESSFDLPTIGIMELSCNFIMKVVRSVAFKYQPVNLKLMNAKTKNNVVYIYNKRQSYQPLFSLSQNYPINIEQTINRRFALWTGKNLRQTSQNKINLEKMIRGVENFQMKNLPYNHSLFERERHLYEKSYKISQYKTEPPMCVVVLSNNNIQNDRYKKVMDTITMQHYNNYHIVFIDDVSEDNTFNATKQYAKKIGIQDEKIAFVKNQERKYATYNLRNAAHNYCESHDILVIVDGDDELVGRYVFKLISVFYQDKKQQNWIVYTNYLTSLYELGASYQIPSFYKTKPQKYRKQPMHLMGPVRSFYTQLFRNIHDQDHKYSNGTYLNTMYDDAMQYPMLQMAGYHVHYIPQICYLYNKLTGNNDNSTPEKKSHKKQTYKFILQKPTYQRLKTLFKN